MRFVHLPALLLALAACAAPPAGEMAVVQPAPFGTACHHPCALRVENHTPQPLTVYAATADGTRPLGIVQPGKTRIFSERVIAPSYGVAPAITAGAHGTAAATTPVPVSCADQNPRPDEEMLLVCR